jgi:hydroxymethylpyrimidine pyrophosphatase-like HAD family hydrolase|tara:strand:- start:203 stop:622 length:420 start_codon:yes stop_codon:yes gene_type:complete
MDIVLNKLQEYKKYENDGVMFDIDDTLIRSSDGVIIHDIFKILVHAYNMGYRVIIVTARPPESEEYTRKQLREKDIPYHGLYFAPPGEKGNLKRSLNVRFVLSVGDLETDCTDSLFALKVPTQENPQGYFKSNDDIKFP